MSFYGHQSVQNNTFQELLIFRSRYDANTTVADVDSELTGGKMFWVKTIKDYPYVEISHGKPKLTETSIFSAQANGQYKTSIAANKNLEFGKTIQVPNIQVADTGHIIGAEAQNLALPFIKTTSPITITGAQTHSPTIGHNIYAQDGATLTEFLATAATINAEFGQTINVNLPNFDQWGHYYSDTPQKIKIPNITVPTIGPISITPSYGTTKTITHKTATAVRPELTKANTIINNNLSSIYESELGDTNILSVAQTDEYGHSNKKIDLPFQINHPKPYTEIIEVESYLTPTTTVQTAATKSSSSKTKLDFWFEYPVGLNYLPIRSGSSAEIDLKLTNYNYTISSAQEFKSITITIEDTKFANGNWTFTPKEGVLEQINGKTYRLATTSLPNVGNTKVIGTFTITAQSSFNSGVLYINNSFAVGNIAKLTIKSSNATIDTSNGIQIWDSNKLLCLPNLRITEEGHVEKVGETYIQLGEIGNNSGSNSNPSSDNPTNPLDPNNPNPIIVRGMTIQLKVAVNQSDYGFALARTLTFNATGAQFQVAHNNGNIQTPVEIGGQNSSSELQLSQKYSKFSIAYIHKPNSAKAFKINDTQYYWAEPNLDNLTWEEYSISEEDLNSGNTIVLHVHIPVTTTTPQQQNLVPIKIAAKLEGVIDYLNELKFQLYSDQSPSSAPLSAKYKTIKQIVDGNATTSIVSLNSTPETIGEGDNAQIYYTSGLIYIDKNELFANGDLTVKAYINPSGDIAHWRFTGITLGSVRPLPDDLSVNHPQYYYFTAKAQAASSTTNPIRTTSSQSTTNTQVEDRLSTLEQSMLQLTNISDLKSVNNMESRLKLLEGQLAPVDYDTETEQMAAKNRLEEIETKVEETKAATEYANVDDKSISIEKSYKILLLYYTGLVDFIADYLYKQTTTSTENVEAFRTTYQLPLLKGESLIPTGTIPSFSPPVNDGGN